MASKWGPLARKWRKMALTDVAIKNAKRRDKPYKMGDTLGLFLLVQPTGGKLWRLKYRVDGKEKKLGLGTYPEVSLSDARKRRDDARELVAAGVRPDPRSAWRADRTHGDALWRCDGCQPRGATLARH